MPAECFRFEAGAAKAAPDRSAQAYFAGVLEAVRLSAGCEIRGYSHLSAAEGEALRAIIARKASAFWVKGTSRSAMRGFRHDVITTGLPVRGRPIRLKGAEGESVRKELDEDVAQGLYTRGMSTWGS